MMAAAKAINRTPASAHDVANTTGKAHQRFDI
jgi:hypothetical protein